MRKVESGACMQPHVRDGMVYFGKLDPRKRQVKVTSCLHLVEPNFTQNPSQNGRPFKGLFNQRFCNFAPKKTAHFSVKVG